MNPKKVDIDIDMGLDDPAGFFDFLTASEPTTVTGLLNTYIPVFIVAFLATIIVTPVRLSL